MNSLANDSLIISREDATYHRAFNVFNNEAKKWGFEYRFTTNYNCNKVDVPDDVPVLFSLRWLKSTDRYLVVELEKSIVYLHLGGGSISVEIAYAKDADPIDLLDKIKEFAPIEEIEEDSIYVTFWAHGQHGPTSVRRKLQVSEWEEISRNYTESVQSDLESYMDPEFRFKKSGQLLLWHGEPGTGKTTALRSLGFSWRKWCEIHYIADPEKFFGSHADYMLKVMTDYSSDEWRLLVLEDTGEFLTVDARTRTGNQGLSRFLNAMDGLLGQGLSFSCLVTTNEELKKLHPAVTRPGRCLSKIEFTSLSEDETIDWCERHSLDIDVAGPMNLADLYSILEGDAPKRKEKKLVGFAV